MGDLELFFGALIVVGVFVGVVVFARNSRSGLPGDPVSTAGKEGSTHSHRGINSTSLAGEGLGNPAHHDRFRLHVLWNLSAPPQSMVPGSFYCR